MKKAVLKFRSGSGAIFAFLILAFVFASIAAVVYVVISQSPSKTPQAALTPSCFYSGHDQFTTGTKAIVTYQGFAVDEHIYIVEALGGTQVQDLGFTEDSLSRSKGKIFTFTISSPGVYQILIGTRFPAQNYNCGVQREFTPNVIPPLIMFADIPSSQCAAGMALLDVTYVVANVPGHMYVDYSFTSSSFASGTYQSIDIGDGYYMSGSKAGLISSQGSTVYVRIRDNIGGRLYYSDRKTVSNPCPIVVPSPSPSPTPTPTPPPISCVTFINSAGVLKKYGDDNNNNIVNANDATLVKQTVFGVTPPLVRGTDAFKAADVNGNNVVSAADGTLINQFYFKIITQFPIPGCS